MQDILSYCRRRQYNYVRRIDWVTNTKSLIHKKIDCHAKLMLFHTIRYMCHITQPICLIQLAHGHSELLLVHIVNVMQYLLHSFRIVFYIGGFFFFFFFLFFSIFEFIAEMIASQKCLDLNILSYFYFLNKYILLFITIMKYAIKNIYQI